MLFLQNLDAKIVTYFGIAKYLGWKMERSRFSNAYSLLPWRGKGILFVTWVRHLKEVWHI